MVNFVHFAITSVIGSTYNHSFAELFDKKILAKVLKKYFQNVAH